MLRQLRRCESLTSIRQEVVSLGLVFKCIYAVLVVFARGLVWTIFFLGTWTVGVRIVRLTHTTHSQDISLQNTQVSRWIL
jgi:hypothetical protein